MILAHQRRGVTQLNNYWFTTLYSYFSTVALFDIAMALVHFLPTFCVSDVHNVLLAYVNTANTDTKGSTNARSCMYCLCLVHSVSA